MSPQNSSVKGFTLVELMVVLAIASIMLAMMLPNVSGYMSSLEINAAAEELATDLRSARQLAISKNVKTAIVIDINARQYALYRMPMPGKPWQGPLGAMEPIITSLSQPGHCRGMGPSAISPFPMQLHRFPSSSIPTAPAAVEPFT